MNREATVLHPFALFTDSSFAGGRQWQRRGFARMVFGTGRA